MSDKVCGIYKIASPSGKIYIGQSVDINFRFWKYRKLHCKAQTKLYASFMKHGVEAHQFEVVRLCEPSELNALEQHYVALYDTFNSAHGMNLRDGGGSHGKWSEETKKKFRTWKRKPISESTRLKKSAIMKKRMRENNPFLGKPLSESHKSNISRANRSVPHTEEWNRNMAKALTGHKHSEETKRKIGLKSKGRKWSEAAKARIRNRPGRKWTTAEKRKLSNTLRQKKAAA